MTGPILSLGVLLRMIHKYTSNGYFIVLDVNSGAVHVVDELFYDILDYLSEDRGRYQ